MFNRFNKKTVSSEPKSQTKLKENDRVIIRLWLPDNEGCGHVSIETQSPQNYYSLWPKHDFDIKNSGSGLFTSTQHKLHTYEDDLKAEGRDPEVRVALYRLHGRSMRRKFDTIKENLNGWRLIGSHALARITNMTSGESCASLAYRLLVAGGLNQLVSSSVSTKESIVVTPTDLSKIAKQAKQYELTHYPETKEFTWETETSVSVNENNCLIL
jgi:hypothetical protein